MKQDAGEDNIKMDVIRLWWEGEDWIKFVYDRGVCWGVYDNQPSDSLQGKEYFDWLSSFTWSLQLSTPAVLEDRSYLLYTSILSHN
jgi:hypothetical protein